MKLKYFFALLAASAFSLVGNDGPGKGVPIQNSGMLKQKGYKGYIDHQNYYRVGCLLTVKSAKSLQTGWVYRTRNPSDCEHLAVRTVISIPVSYEVVHVPSSGITAILKRIGKRNFPYF